MPRRLPIVLLSCIAAALSACDSGPPQAADYGADGRYAEINVGDIPARGSYAWRQPDGGSLGVLVSDRVLPTLPVDDPFPLIDLGLALSWVEAPYFVVKLAADGELIGYAARGNGGVAAECAGNPGACYSAVSYVGTDAISASYEFGKSLDLTVRLPLRHHSTFQAAPTDDVRPAPDGSRRLPASDDHDRMAERYARVRAALNRADVDGFLEANGYSQAQRAVLGTIVGMKEGITRLSILCPQAETFEAFGSDGGWGALLADRDGGQTPVYFLRRGDDWLLHSCGS